MQAHDEMKILETVLAWMLNNNNNNNAHLMDLCPGLSRWVGTRKVKPIKIYWSKRQWDVVASAGPYAFLYLAQIDNHASTHNSVVTGHTPFLPPNQQRQTLKAQHWMVTR